MWVAVEDGDAVAVGVDVGVGCRCRGLLEPELERAAAPPRISVDREERPRDDAVREEEERGNEERPDMLLHEEDSDGSARSSWTLDRC